MTKGKIISTKLQEWVGSFKIIIDIDISYYIRTFTLLVSDYKLPTLFCGLRIIFGIFNWEELINMEVDVIYQKYDKHHTKIGKDGLWICSDCLDFRFEPSEKFIEKGLI